MNELQRGLRFLQQKMGIRSQAWKRPQKEGPWASQPHLGANR